MADPADIGPAHQCPTCFAWGPAETCARCEVQACDDEPEPGREAPAPVPDSSDAVVQTYDPDDLQITLGGVALPEFGADLEPMRRRLRGTIKTITFTCTLTVTKGGPLWPPGRDE